MNEEKGENMSNHNNRPSLKQEEQPAHQSKLFRAPEEEKDIEINHSRKNNRNATEVSGLDSSKHVISSDASSKR